jgi:hypothetical protein
MRERRHDLDWLSVIAMLPRVLSQCDPFRRTFVGLLTLPDHANLTFEAERFTALNVVKLSREHAQ